MNIRNNGNLLFWTEIISKKNSKAFCPNVKETPFWKMENGLNGLEMKIVVFQTQIL